MAQGSENVRKRREDKPRIVLNFVLSRVEGQVLNRIYSLMGTRMQSKMMKWNEYVSDDAVDRQWIGPDSSYESKGNWREDDMKYDVQ